MLEHPCIRRYSLMSHPLRSVCGMSSDNPTGADHQQETADITLAPQSLLEPSWIVGFVDGEGCFYVSIHRNPHVRQTRGWQTPSFRSTNTRGTERCSKSSEPASDVEPSEAKGPNSSVLTFAVDALRDLEAKVLPKFRDCNPKATGYIHR